ncbi:MAG: TonB-dependent receptor [Pseudomonadales bacterium]|nr:TonB-dependent receptor [Pseudomonadales bacterium]
MTIAQDTQVEEVVVTGSFIRRSEGFSQASQTTQLTAEDLEAEGTLNMGEVVQQMSFVNGAASAITNTIQGTNSRTSSIDLRGLGASSTLTLLDGKRLVNQNVNGLIPTIAIQRIDIVADGAAALYGNEAVAGVVNFVPYRSYDGLRVETFAEGDSRGDWDHHSAQVLWGGDIGDLDVVFAGQFRASSRLGWDERPLLAQSGLAQSSNAPGNYRVPERDASGAYTGNYIDRPDPNCAPASQRQSLQPDVANNPYGILLGNTCWFDFGDTRSYFEPEEDTKFFLNATWDYSDDLTLSFQGLNTRLTQMTYTSTSNPGNSRIGELPAIRGEIPGNPFRAVDANGNPLFGVDANGDGVPDRGSSDLNGDGWMDAIISGTADNGVPLYEDVRARTLRPINKTHTVSAGHSFDNDNLADDVDTISRYSFQADFTVPFLDGWEGMASWTYNERDYVFMSTQNYDIEAMIQGVNCDVVNDRESCYNPFFVVDEADNNSQQVIDAIAGRSFERVTDTLGVFDIILNGELPLGGFELPGGPVGVAVGYQFRDDSYTNIPSEEEIAGITWIGGTDRESLTSGDREVDAFFAEFAIPVLSNLEIEAAVRNESFSTGQESTDPKFGVTWQATDWLTLRATQGEAFIAPSLEDLLDPVTCGLSTVTDRFGPHSGFTTACSGGNPNLQNETSKSRQIGFDVAFNDFDFSVTWNETDFSNRIVDTTGQQIMELDFFRFKQATGFTGSGQAGDQPTEQQLRDWIANPLSNKDIIRDPNDPLTILQVNGLGSSNAETVKVTAYDIQGNYSFSIGSLGDFRVGLQATYIDEFLYQEDPTAAVVDAAGKYNDTTGAAPELPQLKANLRLGWNLGNHAISSTVRYVDDMPYDGPLYSFMDFFANTYRDPSIATTGVKAWTDVDMAYTYRGLNVWDGEMSFSVGARNLFDREAQRSPELAGVLGGLQDPRGRIIYGRLVYDF